MAAVAQPVAETKIALNNVPWSTYQELLDAHVDQPGIRFFFDVGELEIMTVSIRHERPAKLLNMIVETLAEEWGTDIQNVGSATFKGEELGKGFEPDNCYYIATAADLPDDPDLDAENAPAPDLIIEVDITSSSLRRSPIYGAFGVPEVWRYDERRTAIYRLENGEYREREASASFPLLTSADLTRWMDDPLAQKRRTLWIRAIRQWARAAKAPASDNTDS